MPVKKRKISELPIVETLKGLFTVGVDAKNRSVKVDLGFVEEASEKATTAAQLAQETATHPTYIGGDYFVYEWNVASKQYIKTDIYVKGIPGAGGGTAVICSSYEELQAISQDVSEGTFGIIKGGTSGLIDGRVISELNIDTSVAPVFDWTGAESGIAPIAAFVSSQSSVGYALICLSMGDVTLIALGDFMSNNPIYLYFSRDYAIDGVNYTEGWQTGVELLNFNAPHTVVLGGSPIPDAPPLVNIVTNFNDIFTSGVTTTDINNIYVFINGGWVQYTGGRIDESALPTASSASSIAHLRALNTSGESVNIAPNSIADLALRTANKTKVQTLAGMDYSLLTEQIVRGEYWMDMNGTKKQVYTRTFKGRLHGVIGGNYIAQNCFSSNTPQILSAQGSANGYITGDDINSYSIPLGRDWSIWSIGEGLVYVTHRADLGLMTYMLTIKYVL